MSIKIVHQNITLSLFELQFVDYLLIFLCNFSINLCVTYFVELQFQYIVFGFNEGQQLYIFYES